MIIMPSYSYPIIAREGWFPAFLLLILLVLAVIFLGTVISLIIAAVLVIFLYLMRDPVREIPSLPLAIVSPVHGRVIADNEVDDEWIKRRARQVILKTSPLDIYSLRSPIEGKVVNQWTRKPDGQHSNRLFAFRVRGDEGDEVVVVIHLNILTAALFRFYVHSGERLGHGQRCGFLYLGGCVEVLMPINSRMRIKPDEQVTSGSDILAQLVHKNAASLIQDEQSIDIK